MTKVTELEKAVLINIAENEMTPSNGAVPENYEECEGTWTESIEQGGPVLTVSGKSFSGVMSSLTKKNLIDGFEDGADSQTWLTEEGFDIYKTFDR